MTKAIPLIFILAFTAGCTTAAYDSTYDSSWKPSVPIPKPAPKLKPAPKPVPKYNYNKVSFHKSLDLTGQKDDVSRATCEGKIQYIAMYCQTQKLRGVIEGKIPKYYLVADSSISCQNFVSDYTKGKLDYMCK